MKDFDELINIIKQLRSPSGCPWDREQSPETMRKCVVEECYELLNAIDNNDIENIKEELGDLYLNVSMIAYMYKQENKFSLEDVLTKINAKLIRRHPHVFGEIIASNSTEALASWNKEKDKEKSKKDSILNSIPKDFPPILKATKLQQKASKVGFDWDNIDDVYSKIYEEIEEVKATSNSKDAEEEIGDLLFSIVNLARHLKVDSSVALNRANEKFIKRFKYVEKNCDFSKNPSLDEMDKYWNEAKNL